jgi:hypothetical protein
MKTNKLSLLACVAASIGIMCFAFGYYCNRTNEARNNKTVTPSRPLYLMMNQDSDGNVVLFYSYYKTTDNTVVRHGAYFERMSDNDEKWALYVDGVPDTSGIRISRMAEIKGK